MSDLDLDDLFRFLGEEFQQEEEKENTMSEKTVKNFQVDYERFETYEEALETAQKEAMRRQKDTMVWVARSTVKYPVPNYPVEDVIVAATPVVA